jgi:hypothetical protein
MVLVILKMDLNPIVYLIIITIIIIIIIVCELKVFILKMVNVIGGII